MKASVALPGVRRGVGVLLELAVEEAVRRARVGDDLVLDPGRGQRRVEGRVVLGGDVRVVAGLEREDRRGELGGALRRARVAVSLAGHPVEADRAGEAVAAARPRATSCGRRSRSRR